MSCGNHHDVPCVQIHAWMWIYLDNELEQNSAHLVGHHLQECPPCADQFTAERVIQTRIRQCSESVQTPEGLRMRIFTQIQQTITER
jgi:anti-sigma factor (TIGR02949 family)